MTLLVDTNILVRIADRSDAAHPTARRAVRKLFRQGDELVVTLQNFAEFWAVATRPKAVNGLGVPVALADKWLQRFERICTVLPDTPDVYREWRRLIVTYAVAGVQVHDARLAAAMLAHGVTHVLTFNAGDFARFAPEGLTPADPAGV
ncbi:MAG TPA: type II toxin-antitoxin system VapC family toxin [Planctomycetaceae bacterium]